MIAIKGKRAQFIAVVLTRDRENGQRDLLQLLARRNHRVVVRVSHWMFEDALKIGGGIPDERIERLKGDVLLVSVQEFCAPEFLIAEKILLSGASAGEREPLHVVGFSHIMVRRIIERWMGGCGGNNCRETWREFFRRRPLIESRVGTAPHRGLAVSEQLFCLPLYGIVPIARLICKRFELATGVSAAANIDERERVTVRCEVRGA